MFQLRLTSTQKHTVWSPLPALLLFPNKHTTRPSGSPNRLRLDQVVRWTEFRGAVLNRVKPLGAPPETLAIPTAKAFHVIGNETGLQGQFTHHIGHMLGPIFSKSKVDLFMADFQVGVHVDNIKLQGKEERMEQFDLGKRQPDLVIVSSQDQVVHLVGEIKACWTFKSAKGQSHEDYLAQKLGIYSFAQLLCCETRAGEAKRFIGQIVRYMDDCRCRFRFYSMYEKT